MKEVTKSATTNTAYGKTLDTPITYDYTFSTYENFAEVQAANDTLTNDEQVKVRNNEKQSNARQKALTAALDAAGYVKPTIENDDQMKLREMYKILMATKKYDEQAARQLAATTVGVEWAE